MVHENGHFCKTAIVLCRQLMNFSKKCHKNSDLHHNNQHQGIDLEYIYVINT